MGSGHMNLQYDLFANFNSKEFVGGVESSNKKIVTNYCFEKIFSKNAFF